ncbi:hypothetical protein D3C81_1022050 [compost metagenome]
MQARAVQAAQRNGFNLGGGTLNARLGYVAVDGGGQRILSATGNGAPDAVEVVVTRQVPASLVLNLAALFPGSGQTSTVNLRAEAVARRSAVASFSVGSGLLRLDSSQSPLLAPVLDGLLDGDVQLGALTPAGIASADVRLLDFLQLLQMRANIGTLNQLLDSRIGALPYVEVIATLLRTDGVLASGLDGARLANIGSVNTKLRDMLGLDLATQSEAVKSNVNLFELLLVGAITANGQRSVALALNVPRLAGATLVVTESPRFAFGPPGTDSSGKWRTQASTGQLELVLQVESQLPGLLSMGGKLVDAEVDLALRVGLAEAQGRLSRIGCGNPQEVVIDATTKTDNVRLTSASSPTVPASISLKVLGLQALKADIALDGAVVGSNTQQLVFQVSRSRNAAGQVVRSPQPGTKALDSPVEVKLPALKSLSLHSLSGNCGFLDLVCIAAKTVLNLAGGAVGLLDVALSTLSSSILQPLLNTLGIQLGYSDITLTDVQASTPRLVR